MPNLPASNDITLEVPSLSIPTMLARSELAYLYTYARDHYRGVGEMVDLGCWLGGGTAHLAAGLSDARDLLTREKYVHAFDLFQWESYMDQEMKGTDPDGGLRAGQSFLPAFLSYLEPWKERVKAYQSDLRKAPWTGGPIEFLLIDAMKSWEVAHHIIEAFFPSLRLGSKILHQDFSHYYTYWIHPIQYRLRNCFKVVDDIPDSCSTVFELIRPLPEKLVRSQFSDESLSPLEIEEAFDYSLSLTSLPKHGRILAAKLRCLFECRYFRQAREAVERYSSAFCSNPEFAAVARTIESSPLQDALQLG